MINPDALVKDLKQQVLALEADLRERIKLPQFNEPWTDEHRAARAGDRTAQTFTEWADDRITQAAVSWVLTTVFIRFCEDNRLLGPVWISGPPERRQEALDAQLAYFRTNPEDTDREWVWQGIQHLAATPATKGLVDQQAMLHTVSPSGQAVTKLLDFWRTLDDAGNLVQDFTDPDLGTRFLGDLYQDLSDHAKKTYALLQTPEYVEEFILDRTLEPALRDHSLEGFKLIDPACGSGHFLLGSFRRLLTRWEAEAPALGLRERTQNALDSVWGVDINPFAAAIAHFRLTVAALLAIGSTSLEGAPDFRVHVLSGDSLWFSRVKEGLFSSAKEFAYHTEEREALFEALKSDQYHAVVANPPYITVKDKALNAAYRERFSHLKGKYQLTAPFMELLFSLARRGSGSTRAGWVGQITSNAFMKRDFGKPMINDLLAHLDVREIIDSGIVNLPGHGTPTVILTARNAAPTSPEITVVAGKRLDPTPGTYTSTSPAWKVIEQNASAIGYSDDWVAVTQEPRTAFQTHPWSLSGSDAASLAEIMSAAPHTLGDLISAIGYSSITGDDEFLLGSSSLARRLDCEPVHYIIGEEIRDYGYRSRRRSLVPQGRDGSPFEPSRALAQHLWRGRTILANRLYFGKRPRERGMRWFDYAIYFPERNLNREKIVYSDLATHNHFAIDRNAAVLNAHGQVVVPKDPHDIYGLLGILGSSMSCFWLKEHSYPKGNESDPWAARYEYTNGTLRGLPIPEIMPTSLGLALDRLAQSRAAADLDGLEYCKRPTSTLISDWAQQHATCSGLMVSLQEEIDWSLYASYGVIDESLTTSADAPVVELGQRSFEIVLARRIEAGEEDTTWFERHGSTPITEIPAHWPADYRALVQRRIDAIESVDAIRLLETPEFKRRWATEPFRKQRNRALGGWLLDRLEARELWFTPQGQVRPQTVGQLADALGRDADFVSVVDLWTGRRDSDLVAALTSLLDSEAVPYLAAHRLEDPGLRKFAEWQRTWDLQRREDAGEPVGDIPVPPKYAKSDFRKDAYWSVRGKLDVPRERFILYPGAGRETDHTLLLGWAGWDHAQQSLALAIIIQQRQADGAPDEVLVPLVAGLAEVQPWVEQWHSELDPEFGLSPAQFSADQLRTHMLALGVTHDDLAAWRPPAATRGRKARS